MQLTPEIEQIVITKVQTGRYSSPAEVIREALRLLEERDHLQTLHRQELQQKITKGLESLRSGKSIDGEAVFDRIEAELDELERRDRL
jgi:antitoxin ParD1/3/4